MTYAAEFKRGGSGDYLNAVPELIAPTKTGTSTTSWADILTLAEANALTGAQGPAFAIVTNSHSANMAVAFSNDAAPTAFHVVQAGTQRALLISNGAAMKAKLL